MILSLDLMILGIVTLIYIVVIMVAAVIIIINSFKVKNKTLLYAGLSYIGLATAWSGVAFNFISVVFFNITPSMELYFLLHGTYIPISSFLWILTCLYLSSIKESKRKLIIIILGIFYSILEVIYIAIIFTDTTILGTPINEIQVDYEIFSEIFLLYIIVVTTVLGFWMAKQAYRSEDKRIKLKGKLLFYSFGLFAIVAFLEIMIPIIPVLILARILAMVCAVLFYGGYLLPKWLERLFLKEA